MRRILATILMVLTIIGFSSIGYATNFESSKYELINPEKLSYSTIDRVVLINGKAPSGTNVAIDVYGTTDLTRKNFNLDKLPTDNDYILIKNEEVTSGNLRLFQKKLDLVRGVNKLVINFDVEEVEPIEIIIFVYDATKAGNSFTLNSNSRLNSLLPLTK